MGHHDGQQGERRFHVAPRWQGEHWMRRGALLQRRFAGSRLRRGVGVPPARSRVVQRFARPWATRARMLVAFLGHGCLRSRLGHFKFTIVAFRALCTHLGCLATAQRSVFHHTADRGIAHFCLSSILYSWGQRDLDLRTPHINVFYFDAWSSKPGRGAACSFRTWPSSVALGQARVQLRQLDAGTFQVEVRVAHREKMVPDGRSSCDPMGASRRSSVEGWPRWRRS